MKTISMFTTLSAFAVILLAGSAAWAQNGETGPIRSSAAYAEVLLRRTELQAELESMLTSLTDANPRVLDAKFEIAALNKSIERIFGVKPSETGRLTLALGKLIVRQAAAETELNRLQRSYNKDQPEVKRAKRRLEIFQAAVDEILR